MRAPLPRHARCGRWLAGEGAKENAMNQNLYAVFEQRFPDDGQAVFLRTADGTAVTFDALRAGAGRYAQALIDRGVRPGDRVAVQVEKSPEAVYLYLACLQAGAIYLPLNTGYTGAEMAYFLGDAEPTVAVCAPEAEAALAPIAAQAGVPHLLTLGTSGDGSLPTAAEGLGPRQEIAPATADDVAAILYTSGTTGRSKGAMLTHGNLASNALALHEAWGFRPDDVLLHALPLFHTHGLFVAMNIMLLNGGTVILLPKFDAAQIIALMPQATVLMGVPTFYTRLLARDDFTAGTVRGMRLFVSGSAPLLADTFTAFEARTGQRILERYGMTETCMNTSNPLDGERRAGTVGLPLPGVEVRVCDKDGGVLPPGEIGVLEVRGPNVFKGYWRMPEKTASEFRDGGWFITGDNATVGADGYVTIVGRDKDLIISGGFNVYPKEVEQVLDDQPGVAESAVVGVPHPDFGEAVVAVVVAEPSAARPDADSLIASTAERLARYKMPKRIFFVDELPRNTMGKVQKAVLREAYGATFTAPTGPPEGGENLIWRRMP